MKTLFFVLMSLLFSPLAFSESDSLRLAPSVGYRSNGVYTTEPITGVYDAGTPGFQAGGILYYSLSEKWWLRTGLFYVDRTANGSMTVINKNVNFKTHMTYLDIPIGIQVSVFDPKFYVFGGLKAALNLSSSCDISDAPAGVNVACSLDMSATDFMTDLGVGYEALKLGVGVIAFDAEYEYGISNVLGSKPALYTKGWTLSALYKISL